MKIYLDAGHNYSGIDTGSVGNGLREQDITYYIAVKVQRILESKGVNVMMSRNKLTDNVISSGTVNDSLKARYTAANNWGADVFVSIHCNAGGGTGCEVYCYNKSGKSEILAKDILNGMLWNTDLRSRGVKINPGLSVIKNTNMPAALVETAFIDNAADAEILGSEDGQTIIAKGIAEGIMEYLGVDYADNSAEKIKQELTTPNDIVWELANRGLVTDKDGMIDEMEQNPNGRLYWLARKVVNK